MFTGSCLHYASNSVKKSKKNLYKIKPTNKYCKIISNELYFKKLNCYNKIHK